MILRLRVKNFRRYSDQVVEFSEGVNVLEGGNNAGKTSLFYAIEYALFGTVAGFASPAALLRPGAGAVGAELIFRARDGTCFRLQRIHVRPAKAKAKVVGHFTLKRLEDPADPEGAEHYVLSSDFQDREEALALRLSELLGLSRRVFDTAVHMRQGAIGAILEGTPDLDKVLGVTAAGVVTEQLRATALEFEKQTHSLPVLAETLRHLRAARDAEEGRRQAQEAELAGLRRNLARTEAVAAWTDRLEALRRPLRPALSAVEKALRGVEDADRAAAALDAQIAGLGSPGAADAEIAGLEGRDAELAGEAERLETGRAGRGRERRKLDAARGDLKGRLSRVEALPKGENAACQTCGQPIDQARRTRETRAWKRELAELDGKLAALDEADKADGRRAGELSAERRKCAEALAGLRERRRQAAELQARRESQAAARTAAGRSHDDAVQALRGAVEACRAGLAAFAAEHPGSAPPAPEIDPADPDAARDALARFDETFTRTVVSAGAERDALARNADRLAAELGEADRRRAETDREIARVGAEVDALARKLDAVTKLRDLESAFKRLQLELRERAAGRLSADTLELHRRLAGEAEFSALTVDPARYAVMVTPHDIGAEVPASTHQGGGHRVLLGLAFRLAIVRLLGAGGFLLLDEPTEGLDPAHRARLPEALRELADVRQIIAITHHPIETAGVRRLRVVRRGDDSAVEVSP